MIVSFAYEACVMPISYWGNVHSYAAMLQSKQVWVEACEHYQKQTFRNRCQILGSNGVLDLTIPIDHVISQKGGIRQTLISNTTPWQQVHWKALVSAYKNSPFFEYYQDDMYEYYHQPYEILWDYLWQLQDFAWECIGWKPHILPSTDFERQVSSSTMDFRNILTPKSAKYMEEARQVLNQNPYYQVFDQKFGFVPNLSILDLIFNMGPESLCVLQEIKCQGIGN